LNYFYGDSKLIDFLKGIFTKNGAFSVNKKLNGAFKKVKSEFDEHLDTINQNTNEIQANYEFLCEIDSKLDKLCQRLDEVQMGSINQNSIVKITDLENPIGKLTKREQEVFMILYTNENKDLTYSEISRRLGFKEDMVRNYVSGLSSKGIPILKKFVSNKIFLYLDPAFKDLQARKNVLEISENLAKLFV